MSGLVMGSVLKYSRSRGNARLVLLVIGDCAQDTGLDAWPSIRLIAERAGISERTVQRCLQELVSLGELRIRYKEGPKDANLYDIPLDRLGGVKLTPLAQGGDKSEGGVVTELWRQGGDRAVSPDPSSYVSKRSVSIDPAFDEFYKLYPKKVEKPEAINEWKKLKPESDLVAKIMERLRTFIAVDWSATPTHFMPSPGRWLKKRKWEDEVIRPSNGQPQLFTQPEERPFVAIPILPRKKLTAEELEERERRHAAEFAKTKERWAQQSRSNGRAGVS